jgi:hypothetical protein
MKWRKWIGFSALIVLLTSIICRVSTPVNVQVGSVTFLSSDKILVQRFQWAKKTALSYVNEGDPIGLWYESALPGREAFCMRDVSHQSLGAAVLGLQHHTKNMLRRFAENIAESRDWCTFWEINCNNQPAPVDYRNDDEFWYNLPANFDVLDACYRQYQWTGDQTYVDDPIFLNFYQRTVQDYVDRWDLGLDKIMIRERYMNLRRPFNQKDSFHVCRGLPSYGEEDPGSLRLGVDLLAAQSAAFRSYAAFQALRKNREESILYEQRGKRILSFIDSDWWDSQTGQYFSSYTMNSQLIHGPYDMYVLYFNASISHDKSRRTLMNLMNTDRIGIELQSHFPEIFYRYDENVAAYQKILQLTDDKKARRDYPEVSYAMIGAIASGLMGINPEASIEGVETLSRLTSKTEWVELKGIPVLGRLITVRHQSKYRSEFTLENGAPITWLAQFYGEHKVLLVDGKQEESVRLDTPGGQIKSQVSVTVKPGRKVIVCVPDVEGPKLEF